MGGGILFDFEVCEDGLEAQDDCFLLRNLCFLSVALEALELCPLLVEDRLGWTEEVLLGWEEVSAESGAAMRMSLARLKPCPKVLRVAMKWEGEAGVEVV
jgi:hypothetical protein